MFDAVAFAGGGNRCYWQGGFWETAAPPLGLKPGLVVGVSAGAWSACYSLLGLGRRVNEIVAEGCSLGRRNFEWRAWRREGSPWPVSRMYRSLIDAIIDEATFERLRSGPDILIGLARKPRRFPLAIAIPLGIATYRIEKKWRAPLHPKGGRAIGFRPEFVRVQDLSSPAELSAALMASASVPPFMPVGRIGGMAALDGGLVDNVPAEPLIAVEERGGKTLVILSRLYRGIPHVSGRTYVQPSEPVPVGQFDITNPAGIRKAYEMGLRDGESFAKRLSRHDLPVFDGQEAFRRIRRTRGHHDAKLDLFHSLEPGHGIRGPCRSHIPVLGKRARQAARFLRRHGGDEPFRA